MINILSKKPKFSLNPEESIIVNGRKLTFILTIDKLPFHGGKVDIYLSKHELHSYHYNGRGINVYRKDKDELTCCCIKKSVRESGKYWGVLQKLVEVIPRSFYD